MNWPGTSRRSRDWPSCSTSHPEESEALDLRGSLSDLGPKAPPVDTLVTIALAQRPDLAAYRLGVSRAQAELAQERAEPSPTPISSTPRSSTGITLRSV